MTEAGTEIAPRAFTDLLRAAARATTRACRC